MVIDIKYTSKIIKIKERVCMRKKVNFLRQKIDISKKKQKNKKKIVLI